MLAQHMSVVVKGGGGGGVHCIAPHGGPSRGAKLCTYLQIHKAG